MKNSYEFIKIEISGANLLLMAAILALVLSNSPFHDYYEKLLHTDFSFNLHIFEFKTNLLFLINEGLMSIFFLVVGLEIKYELLEGALNTYSKALLPGIAALGGMIVPALIYIGCNFNNTVNLRGWAIPIATDIAFALGVLSLLGNKVPAEIKAFLTALAIFDDVAAIIIIALFYTSHLSFIFLGLSLCCIGVLFILNFKNVTSIFLYCIFGFILWVCILNAGINPTLAGIILAFLIPLNHSMIHSPSKKLERILHPFPASERG